MKTSTIPLCAVLAIACVGDPKTDSVTTADTSTTTLIPPMVPPTETGETGLIPPMDPPTDTAVTGDTGFVAPMPPPPDTATVRDSGGSGTVHDTGTPPMEYPTDTAVLPTAPPPPHPATRTGPGLTPLPSVPAVRRP